MKLLQKLTVVLLAAVFAFGAGQKAAARSGGMGGMGDMESSSGGGHSGGMTNEDPMSLSGI